MMQTSKSKQIKRRQQPARIQHTQRKQVANSEWQMAKVNRWQTTNDGSQLQQQHKLCRSPMWRSSLPVLEFHTGDGPPKSDGKKNCCLNLHRGSLHRGKRLLEIINLDIQSWCWLVIAKMIILMVWIQKTILRQIDSYHFITYFTLVRPLLSSLILICSDVGAKFVQYHSWCCEVE